MARKKVIKKRTRAGGELAARATALLDEVWAEHVEAEEQGDLVQKQPTSLGIRFASSPAGGRGGR